MSAKLYMLELLSRAMSACSGLKITPFVGTRELRKGIHQIPSKKNMASTFNPNSGIGPSTLLDKLQCLAVLPLLPLTCVEVLIRRMLWPADTLSFKADFICSLLRA
jgi:hypothetical protein